MTLEIETRDLTLRYGETPALDGLTVRLEPGRIHGLIGRNGSGKTSLLSVIAGFRPATEGQVLADGEPVFENPDAVGRTCLVRGTGDTVEHDWPGDRVRDALAFASAVRPDWDAEYADELVERFRLPDRKRLGELSHGQRCALGVILGLASRAPLTMFDETYLGLDAPSRYAFYDELLRDFMDRPRTIVVSTHLIGEIEQLFEHVTIIDEGRLVLHDDADAVRARGATLTGPATEVDRLVSDLDVLASRQLGPTRATTVYGELGTDLRDRARAAGVQIDGASIQDLFIHLTEPARRET